MSLISSGVCLEVDADFKRRRAENCEYTIMNSFSSDHTATTVLFLLKCLSKVMPRLKGDFILSNHSLTAALQNFLPQRNFGDLWKPWPFWMIIPTTRKISEENLISQLQVICGSTWTSSMVGQHVKGDQKMGSLRAYFLNVSYLS